jgi:hypothetical protein
VRRKGKELRGRERNRQAELIVAPVSSTLETEEVDSVPVYYYY